MFNDGQSRASILVQFAYKFAESTHSNRLNHELYTEPSFPAPQMYLLSHTLTSILQNI